MSEMLPSRSRGSMGPRPVSSSSRSWIICSRSPWLSGILAVASMPARIDRSCSRSWSAPSLSRFLRSSLSTTRWCRSVFRSWKACVPMVAEGAPSAAPSGPFVRCRSRPLSPIEHHLRDEETAQEALPLLLAPAAVHPLGERVDVAGDGGALRLLPDEDAAIDRAREGAEVVLDRRRHRQLQRVLDHLAADVRAAVVPVHRDDDA